MLNYKNYILFENKYKENINEVDLVLSEGFINIIKRISDNPISDYLLASNNVLKSKYTYIDITKNENYISCVYYKDYNKNIKRGIWKYKKRKVIRIGKLINKLLDGKYNESVVENFINLYKSIIRENKTYFKVYRGNYIKKWYSENNIDNIGTIGKSCMKFNRCQNYMDLYSNNPDKISLLVLFEKGMGKTKAIGRTLLWDMDKPKIKVMDRIYTSKDSDEFIFERYALNNNIFLTKHNNGLNNFYVKLKPLKYEYYPYLDTLFLYQPHNGLLTDTINNCDLNFDVYILDDTYGYYRLYKE